MSFNIQNMYAYNNAYMFGHLSHPKRQFRRFLRMRNALYTQLTRSGANLKMPR